MIVKKSTELLSEYLKNDNVAPLFIEGESLSLLRDIPDNSINCVITSPPYWLQREYENGGIGQEETRELYIKGILEFCFEIKRILKRDGSFWLNLNDTYFKKSLSAIPWRIAISLIDEQGWLLRNNVIWNKMKGGMDSSSDRLSNVYENIFHFVKEPKYFYDVDAIRIVPRKAAVKNGVVKSATGITGVSYKRKIELSTSLTEIEKENAFKALNEILEDVKKGYLADFRMVIRGQHRIIHSDKEKVSGRARELRDKGFYFLKYNPKGSKPIDVWDIAPEDAQKRTEHFAPYSEDVCIIPILATCPKNGVVLDPFVGTGTTSVVAYRLGRKSIGIDLSSAYLDIAKQRIQLI
ncbi:site-specific DNA-methyltransferase [Providencia rettgeri]|uniref:DNA-methyltransferase n=1 Tax=Providencia TaxID=586 RepID=UPI001BD29EF1|nr:MULTISPECIES: site-specific DNA-methyltransferase [unclassified Providencia]EJD6377287.1 site-specific DNA-methyltransferase [Providencia rettgeri]ELR5117748.1 site-specific DNA-methyltransferase [Providencia rettgeri]HBK4774519.1 site-specific DNA-methyltransferase [Providencia rettgeri]HEF8781022.1 site-specific DNA-methyltransferase [Providencia rettgeri]